MTRNDKVGATDAPPGRPKAKCAPSGAAKDAKRQVRGTTNEARGVLFSQQGPRNRLHRAAGAAAPSGGSAVREATSVGVNYLPPKIAVPTRTMVLPAWIAASRSAVMPIESVSMGLASTPAAFI